MALLFRARHDLLSRGNLTTLSGCCTGTLTSLAWLLLPRPAWVRLVNSAKVGTRWAANETMSRGRSVAKAKGWRAHHTKSAGELRPKAARALDLRARSTLDPTTMPSE